jgi:hypothetical protein
MKRKNETLKEIVARVKYLYITSETKKEQDFYAKILTKINFFQD